MRYFLGFILLLITPRYVLAQEAPVTDVVKYGQDVVIGGHVTGDVVAVGKTVTIDADVDGDVVVIGGYVTVSGTAGAVYVISGTVDVASDVRDGVSVVSLVARLRSPISRAKLWAVAADVSSDVQSLRSQAVETLVRGRLGDAHILGERLVFGRDASVSGTLSVSSNLKTTVLSAQDPPRINTMEQQFSKDTWVESEIAHELFVAMVVLGVFAWLCFRVAPNLWQRGLLFVETQWLHAVAQGFLIVLGFPVIGVALLITVVGAAVGVMVLVLWLGLLLLSQVLWIHWLGSRFLDRLSRKATLAMTLAVGVGVYGLLLSVSIVGPIVALVATVMGAGGLWMAMGKTYASSRKLKLL